MNIRRLFAVWSAHFIKTACRLTGKQGATLAGKAALSIYPPILSELAKEVKKDIKSDLEDFDKLNKDDNELEELIEYLKD